MPIQFNCRCGKLLQAREEHAGRLTRCPVCGAEMAIPGAPAAAVQAVPVAPAPERPARRRDEDEAIAREPRRGRPADDNGPPYDDAKVARKTSGLAIISLILGLLSMCLWLLGGIPALILGIVSLVQISRSRGRLTGKGLAITGIVLSTLNLCCWPAAVGGIYLFRQAQDRQASQNNLQQIGIALYNYHDANQAFPPAANGQRLGVGPGGPGGMPPGAPGGPGGMPPGAPGGPPKRGGLSWRVMLLPYLEQGNLYRQFHLDEPWDSPHNKALLDKMPKVYKHPNSKAPPGYTHYRVFVSTEAVDRGQFPPGAPPGRPGFSYTQPTTMASIMDGTSNTIAVVEAAEAVPWTKPDELEYDGVKPLPKLGGLSRGGFNVLLFDGSVRFLSDSTPESTLRPAITRDGGEVSFLP